MNWNDRFWLSPPLPLLVRNRLQCSPSRQDDPAMLVNGREVIYESRGGIVTMIARIESWANPTHRPKVAGSENDQEYDDVREEVGKRR